MEGVAEQLGPVDAKSLSPLLGVCGLLFVNPEAQHCHTMMITCMTEFRGIGQQLVGACPNGRGEGDLVPLVEGLLRGQWWTMGAGASGGTPPVVLSKAACAATCASADRFAVLTRGGWNACTW